MTATLCSVRDQRTDLRRALAEAIIARDFERLVQLADQMTALDREEGSAFHALAQRHRDRWASPPS